MSKPIYFFDGFYTGHHNSYARNIIAHTNNTILVINKNKEDYFQDIEKQRTIVLEIKDAYSYKIAPIGILINLYKILRNKQIREGGGVYFLYADSIIPFIYLFSKFFKGNIFLTIHWANAVCPIENYRSFFHKVIRNFKFFLFSRLLNKVEKVFVHGESTKNRIISRYKTNKIVKVNYGIEEKNKREEILKKKKKLTASPLNVLFFGGIRKDKGIEKLASLAKLSPEYHFTVAGSPGEYTKDNIEELFKNLNNVRLNLDYIPEDKIQEYFINADVLILPYEYYFSGQSGPLTLSTIYHLPCLGTNVGDMGETIKTEKLGIVVEDNSPEKLKEGLDSISKKLEEYHFYQDKFYNESLWKNVGNKINSTIYEW